MESPSVPIVTSGSAVARTATKHARARRHAQTSTLAVLGSEAAMIPSTGTET